MDTVPTKDMLAAIDLIARAEVQLIAFRDGRGPPTLSAYLLNDIHAFRERGFKAETGDEA